MKDQRKTLNKKDEYLKLKKSAKKQKFQERGITLIALVVTIIILLILAGVTLNIALSDNGLFNKAKKAANDYNKKSIEEELQILFTEKQLDNYANNFSLKVDVTELLEDMVGDKAITEEDIEEFNGYLEKYGEEIKIISSETDFAKIGQEGFPLDGIYIQLGDIDSITAPIGTEDEPFKGVFNGNGNKISSLNIIVTSDNVGIFGVNEGTIKNVTVENCTINANGKYVGAVAGKNSGLIDNCYVRTGSINSKIQYSSIVEGSVSIVGGICGKNIDNGIIRKCENYASVEGTGFEVGGICGWNSGFKIEECFNGGEVKGGAHVGGITGNSGGELKYCINEGNVTSTVKKEDPYWASGAGGITGWAARCKIDHCINKKNVTGSNLVGGIAGMGYIDVTVFNCYNLGDISGTWNEIGGIIGRAGNNAVEGCYNIGEVSVSDSGIYVGDIIGRFFDDIPMDKVVNCYYLKREGNKACGGKEDNASDMGKTEEEMKNFFDSLKEEFVNTELYSNLTWEDKTL